MTDIVWPTRDEVAAKWGYTAGWPLDASHPRLIPDAVYHGLMDYALNHNPTGGFLQAVLENDLYMAAIRADSYSLRGLKAIMMFLGNGVEWIPRNSHGSKQAYADWISNKSDSELK
jgi:hypothetical protein